ncbi:Uncharacterised protein [Flavonifractor plautii]|nr:Uncharacterised protein [Flavonifractor plautii]
MFTVKKKAKTPNMVWDAANNRPLCKFVKGVFETNDEAVAEKLKGMGYEVTGEADAKPIEDMKVDELKAYAAENNIDLGEATKKADILKIIQEAEANK